MRSIFLVRMMGFLGLKVPDTLALRFCEWGLAAFVPLWFSDDVAGLIRQPFSISETFSVQMVGESFFIRKSPTERSGEIQVYYCTLDGKNTLMGLAHYGAFTRREEEYELLVDTNGSRLDRSKPVMFITNIYLDDVDSFFGQWFADSNLVAAVETFDPTRKSRISLARTSQDVQDCSTAEQLVGQ